MDDRDELRRELATVRAELERARNGGAPPRIDLDRRLAGIVRATPDYVLWGSAHTKRPSYINAAMRQLVGIDDDDDPTQSSFSDFHPRDAFETLENEAVPTALRDGVWSGESQLLDREGNTVPVLMHLMAHYDASGDLECMSAIMRDISDRKALEEQLLHSQRLEGIGRLAGGIAHDFNNLLTVILGNADLLGFDIDDTPSSRVALDAIKRAGEQAASLTSQLLAFARRQLIEPKVVDVADLLRGVDKMLDRLLGEDIDLHVVPAPDAWPVRIDPAQFQQIVVNLAVNARGAMPHGGRLMIRTRNRVVENPGTGYPAEVEPGQYVSLTVTDTGTGMTPEAMTHAFEPFFTTKPKGQGTGLGLATCHGIVKQHDGHIFVYSAPGEGTTFDLLFPRARRRFEIAAAPEPKSRPSEGCETVLLAEDEAMVLDLAARCLSSRGYRVLRARDGEEALRVASEHDGTIHLLVTDVIMPRLSGPDCAERLCRARPDLRVLFTSGYTDDAIGQHGVLDGDVAFLKKPYSPDELADRVRRILDEARTASKQAR